MPPLVELEAATFETIEISERDYKTAVTPCQENVLVKITE
jgi:hypothetical protein